MTYTADFDAVSATFHPGAEAEQALTGPGTIGRFVAPGSVTQGRFGLYEWRMAAGAGRADPPFHRNFSESFYVLSGTVRLYDGGSWIDASAGDFLHVPDLLPRARRHLQQRTGALRRGVDRPVRPPRPVPRHLTRLIARR